MRRMFKYLYGCLAACWPRKSTIGTVVYAMDSKNRITRIRRVNNRLEGIYEFYSATVVEHKQESAIVVLAHASVKGHISDIEMKKRLELLMPDWWKEIVKIK